MPNTHYENFPVASPLLPKSMRAPVRVIYAFARSADDLADEGDAGPEERIAALMAYEKALDRIDRGEPPDTPLFRELAATLTTHQLTTRYLRDLLSAFRQDVQQTRYPNFDALLDYCQRSANPVGRIMLSLFGNISERAFRQSDAICSALQIINFLQDVRIDWDKSRVYLPQEDLQRFGVSEQQIGEQRADTRWQALMAFEVNRARSIMLEGAPLTREIPGRLGWELRLIIQGGLRILEKIEAVGYDVFRSRPTLNKRDWLLMLWRAAKHTTSSTRANDS